MQNKLFLKAADICELLEVKQTSAYEIIGNLNKELEEQGYLTLASYFRASMSSFSSLSTLFIEGSFLRTLFRRLCHR